MLIIPFETLNIEKGHLNRWEGLSSLSILQSAVFRIALAHAYHMLTPEWECISMLTRGHALL